MGVVAEAAFTPLAARLQFRILGTLQVSSGEHEVRIAGGKLRSLLAILLVQANRPVSEDGLIEALWEDSATPRASGNLHTLVSRLRRVLGAERVVREGCGYLLRVEDGELDLDRFQELRRAGEPAKALELWRGPALADFVYERWAEGEARRLDELRLVAVEERIDGDLAVGRHADLVPELQALVADEPLRETLRRHLIVALYRCGRQAEALDAYHAARRMLDEDLGLQPGPELRELELAVLRHDPALGAPPKLPRVVAAPGARRRLAAALTASLALLGGFLAALATIDVLDQSGIERPVAAAAPRPASTVKISKTRTRRVVIVREPSRPTRTRHVVETIRAEPEPSVPPQPAVAKQHRRLASLEKPKPKARPRISAPPARAFQLEDDFDDPAFDFGLWHIAGHGSGVEVAERNDRLEFSVGSEVTVDVDYGVDQHYGTGCQLRGDFDARVEFELLDWPEESGMSVTFGAYFAAPDEAFWSISRHGGAEGYATSVASIGRFAAATDVKGTLRLRRAAGLLTMYYRAGGHWVELAGGYAPRPANLILGFNTSAEQFGHHAARAAFDNFEATAAGVSCTEYQLPPYKPAAIDL